jgi:Asp-tRNA(Asn)/Glu-tRNA(Gln) amidotransferase A subunit family amidase
VRRHWRCTASRRRSSATSTAQVPIDRSETGLPIGVQIIGPYLEDRTTIAFVKVLILGETSLS